MGDGVFAFGGSKEVGGNVVGDLFSCSSMTAIIANKSPAA